MHFFQPRHVRRREREKRAQDPRRGQHSEQSAERREHHRLDEQVADQRAATRAERRADGQLALPRHSSGEKKRSHVGAGDQERQQDRPEQRGQRRLHRPDQIVEQRLRLHRPCGVLRDLRVDAGSRHVQLGLRLAHSRAWLEPRDGHHPVHAAELVLPAFHRHRQEHFGLPQEREMEVGRHHAADLVGAPVEDQRAAGDPAIAAELAAPERVGEHGRPRTAGDVLALRRTAPEGRLDLQRGEKAGGDPRDADLHRRPSPRQRLLGRAHAGDGCEDAALAGHVDIVRPRKRPARIGPGRTLVQPHQLLGMRQAERPQDHAADYAENRRASTHPDGEHQHCRRGEARRAPEGPQREAEVIHGDREGKPDAIARPRNLTSRLGDM